MPMTQDSRIYVAGHRGLVGSAIRRELERQGFRRLIGKTRAELDLLNGLAVEDFYEGQGPEYVFVAAAKVGGIHANDSRPAQFLYENLQIQNHLIHGAYRAGVKKLLFLGSSCIYPKLAPQPLKEEYLLSGPLEPTNMYGSNDNYDLETSHVLPAFVRKFHEAKLANASAVTCWGTGTPFREFL